jgi:AcrR family transcriptional regulator
MARPVLTDDQVRDFRERTCDVSMRLFVEQGYEGFSLRALARELGCSHATPYRYFADKAEIFSMVRAESFDRFGSFMQRRLEGHTDALERVHILSRAYFDFAGEHPRAFRMMFELGQPDEDYPFVGEAGFAAWSVMKNVLSEAVEDGALIGKPHELAHIFWAGIHGVATLQLARQFTVGQAAEDVFESMTAALIRAHTNQDHQATSKKK